MRSTRANLRIVLTSNNFWIAVLLCYGVLLADTMDSLFLPEVSSAGFGAVYFFNMSLHFSYYIYAAPLCCAFASSGLFCDDSQAGFYRLRLMKAGKKGYQLGLWFSSTIGGGLALFMSVALFAITCTTRFRFYFIAADIATVDGWIPVLESPFGNIVYLIVNAFLGFLFGLIWSGVGLLFSVFSQNRYVCYFIPFILCFCAQLALPPSLQPNEMLVQMNWSSFSFAKLVGYQAFLYIVTMVLFLRSFHRRILNDKS